MEGWLLANVDMLLPSLEPTLHSLDMIPAILQRVDKMLYRRVLKAVRPPHFAASAVMTWFSHELDDIDKVATLFDFLDFLAASDDILPCCCCSRRKCLADKRSF